ncbi:MAG: serine hydrolase domain-containing protein, partial [Pseudomonadota bacterium]
SRFAHMTLKHPWIVLLLLPLTGATGATTPAASVSDSDHERPSQRLARAVDPVVREVMLQEHLPGVAVVVVRHGRTVLASGYGMADVTKRTPVDPQTTLFRIGSVSKALTALAITRLADLGRLSLEDDVAEHYEGFGDVPNTSGSRAPVRLWHLLTHTGGFDQVGIARHVWQLDKSLAERKALRPSLREFLQRGNLRRVSAPGEYFRYDTYGITLAGAVLESVTGQAYADAMQSVLFQPAGMTRTFVEVPAEFAHDLATGYGYEDGKYRPAPYEIYMTTPASSIDATPADMGRLLEVLTGEGRGVLSAGAVRAVLAPQYRPHHGFPGTTHGMFERFTAHERHPVRSIGHGGSMLGYHTSLTLIPSLAVGVFVVTNRDPEAGGGAISIHARVAGAILDVLHEPAPPTAWDVPAPSEQTDLTPFAGDYAYGVFCHTCTAQEQERGGWQRGAVEKVRAAAGALLIGERQYYAAAEPGVFVSRDGAQRVYFKRDASGRVSSFSYSTSADTFERQ